MNMNRILAVALATIALSACTSERKPDARIVAAFKTMHPSATVERWLDEPPNWEAKYTDGSEHGAVSFDATGKVVETELVIPAEALPTAAGEHIKEHYPAERVQGVERITRMNGTVTYEVQVTGKELVFDADGRFLEEEMD